MNIKKTIKLFDNWASTYDEDVKNEKGPLIGYSKSLELAAENFINLNDKKVLDVGIGTGRFSELLYQKGAKIFGIDISKNMLLKCKEKHNDFVLKQCEFTNIKYPSECFDVVISSFCFHEVEPEMKQKACDEIFRVLKNSGVISIVDIMFPSHYSMELASIEISKYWDSSEDYALVPILDKMLYKSGFKEIKWTQTARCHWNVVARKY